MASTVVQSVLLGCPTEIRQRIYELLLVVVNVPGTDSEYFPRLTRDDGSTLKGPIYPAILRTCRKINTEGSATLYGKNRFAFYGSSSFLQFLYDVGRPNASLVRHVQLLTRVPLVKVAEMDEAFALARGLRTIHISSHTMSCGGPAIQYIIRFYQAMRPLLERHPSLQKVLSQWPRGHMYKKPLHSFDRPWQAIVVTFAAENACASPEQKTFELGTAVAEMEASLKEFTAEHVRRSKEGESEDELALFMRQWEEKIACVP
jgi:hypothetical protein